MAPNTYAGGVYMVVTMEFEEFKRVLEEHTGEQSQLSEDSREVARKVAHLPD